MNTMNKKNGQKKLLAAVAVFAMVACVFAAVPMAVDEADADPVTGVTPVTSDGLTITTNIKDIYVPKVIGGASGVVSIKANNNDSATVYLERGAQIKIDSNGGSTGTFTIYIVNANGWTAPVGPATTGSVTSFDAESKVIVAVDNGKTNTFKAADDGSYYLFDSTTNNMVVDDTTPVATVIVGSTNNVDDKMFTYEQTQNHTFILADGETLTLPWIDADGSVTEAEVGKPYTAVVKTQNASSPPADVNILEIKGAKPAKNKDLTVGYSSSTVTLTNNDSVSDGTFAVTKGTVTAAVATTNMTGAILTASSKVVTAPVSVVDVEQDANYAASVTILKGTILSKDLKICAYDASATGATVLTIPSGFSTGTSDVAFVTSDETNKILTITSTDSWIGTVTVESDIKKTVLGAETGDLTVRAGDVATVDTAKIVGDLNITSAGTLTVGDAGSESLTILGFINMNGNITVTSSNKVYTADGTTSNVVAGNVIVVEKAIIDVSTPEELDNAATEGYLEVNYDNTLTVANGTEVELPEGIIINFYDGSTEEYIVIEATADVNKETSLVIPSGTKVVLYKEAAPAGTLSSTGISVGDKSFLVLEGELVAAEGKYGVVFGAGTMEIASNGAVGARVNIAVANVEGTLADAHVSGATNQDLIFPTIQKVIVDEGTTWTIQNLNAVTIYGSLEVYGTIVIQKGGQLILGNGLGNAQPAVADMIGAITIEEGGVLTIANANVTMSGKLSADGTIDMAGASELTLEAEAALAATGILKNNGASKVVVDSAASFTIYGYLNSAKIQNAGLVTIDNSGIKTRLSGADGNVDIFLIAAGAKVDVRSYLVETGTAEIVINDVGLELVKYNKKTYVIADTSSGAPEGYEYVANPNVITISGEAAGVKVVGSLTVTADVSSEKVDGMTTVTNTLVVAGTLSNSTPSVGEGESATVNDVRMNINSGEEGSVFVADKYQSTAYVSVAKDTTLVIAKEVAVINSAGKFIVAGYIDMTADDVTTINNTAGEITVTGIIKVNTVTIDGSVNAIRYKTTEGTPSVTFNTYTTLDQAVVGIVDASNTSTDRTLNVMGKIIITSDVIVPSPMVVKFDKTSATDSYLKVAADGTNDVTVTFAGGASMSSSKRQVIVNGTLTFDDKTGNSTNKTVSDVVVTDIKSKNGPISYTNIYTALADAEKGQTVSVSRENTDGNSFVELYASITIGKGVTLVVGDDVAPLKLKDGVTMTIEGIVESEQDIYAEHMFGTKAMDVDDSTELKETSAIVVNGELRLDGISVNYGVAVTSTAADAKDQISEFAPIAGAYYSTKDWNVISTLDIAVANFASITSDVITVKGPVIAGDLSVIKTDEDACEGIVLATTDIVATGSTDKVYTVLTVNSLTLDSVKLVVNEKASFTGVVNIDDATITATKVTTMTVTEAEKIMTIIGAPAPIDATKSRESALEITSGTVNAGTKVDSVKATVAMTVAEGAVLETVHIASERISNLTVKGTFNVALGMTAYVGTLTVLGTTSVFAGDDTKSAATLDVTTVYIGTTAEDTIGAGAVFNGPANYTNYIAVLAGSTVDDAAKKSFGDNFTEFYVEDALWITVFAPVGNTVDITTFNEAPVENAYFNEEWRNEKNVVATGNHHIGNNGFKKVTAVVKYDIYRIVLKADEGIANVSIDGNLMKKGIYNDSTNNIAYYAFMADVAAGKHTISYTLANGWSGDAILTVEGETVTGMDFTTEGTPNSTNSVDGIITYELQLTGIEKSGYAADSDSGDSGMGITDYLLIILVILVVVLAALVAMRMMRS